MVGNGLNAASAAGRRICRGAHPVVTLLLLASACSPTSQLAPEPWSCYAIVFGPWGGPTGALPASSALRVFEFTPVAAPAAADERARATAFAARLRGGPSFGNLAPAAAPVWWVVPGTESVVISVADSVRSLDIELSPLDSGLAGVAVSTTKALIRDTTGGYTNIAGGARVKAASVPCPEFRSVLPAGDSTAPGSSDSQLPERPKRISGPPPRYPNQLRQIGSDGRVLVAFVVDTAGQVESGSIAVISSTSPFFIEPTRRAIAASRFEPGRIRGRPIRVRVLQSVNYQVQPQREPS